MAKKKAEKNVIEGIIEDTSRTTLMEVTVKGDFWIGMSLEGHRWIYETDAPVELRRFGSDSVLARYEGFGIDCVSRERYVQLRLVGIPGELQIRESQIASITVFKGKKYNL